jgi:hypothetical protein
MLAVLGISCGLLLTSFVCYGITTALIVHFIARVLHGATEFGFLRTVAIMMIVTAITAASHLFQMALWAVTLFACRQTASFEDAFYLSAQNYTALGYGDVALPAPWRLLGPLEAMNGLLLFGLSTAVMFAVLGRLLARRAGLHLDPPDWSK